MKKEIALRTFGYLIGHYKTHEETIINSQEIEAIEFILKDNEFLEQQCKKQKEIIDKIKKLKQFYIKDFEERNITMIPLFNLTKNIDIVLKEVSE